MKQWWVICINKCCCFVMIKILWFVYVNCMFDRTDVCGLERCGGWEDAYFKVQVCVEYGW